MTIGKWVARGCLAFAAVAFAPQVAIDMSGDQPEGYEMRVDVMTPAMAQDRRDRVDDRRDRVEDRVDDRQAERRRETRRVARRTTRRVNRRHDYYRSLPVGCTRVYLNGYRYWYCGGVYYDELLDNDTTVYIIVNP